MVLTKESIKNLDYESLKELDDIVKKELKKKSQTYLKKVAKKLFMIYPQYEIIVLGIKICDSNNIKKSFSAKNIDKCLLYKAEQEICMNSLNKEFIYNKKNKCYDLFLELNKFININEYEDCNEKNHQYAIFINKDLTIQQTFDYFS